MRPAQDFPVEYTLLRSRRRTIALVISPDAALIVRAPLQAPLPRIECLIREKFDWITRKREELKKRPAPRGKLFVDGERFYYLGMEYPLRFSDEIKGSLYFENEFILSSRERARAKELFVWWYKREAWRVITGRAAFYAARDGFQYRSLKITNARRRWGACSSRGSLTFSWRLVMAPLEVVDYVVVHELVHLEHGDHSSRFWSRVRLLFPRTDHCRAWLKQNGAALDLIPDFSIEKSARRAG